MTVAPAIWTTARQRTAPIHIFMCFCFLRVRLQNEKTLQTERRETQQFGSNEIRVCTLTARVLHNLTPVPASDKCKSLHEEYKWLTSKRRGPPTRLLPQRERPR